jgi:hypothetical protein
MSVNDVWFDARNLTGESTWPKHGPASHRRGEMELSYLSQPLGEAPQILECEDMAIESRAIEAAHDIGEETFHPAIVQILNDMKDASAADCKLARCHDTKIATRRASIRSTSGDSQIQRSTRAFAKQTGRNTR